VVYLSSLTRSALGCDLGQNTLLSIVPLSTQVYKLVLANLMLGLTLGWTSIPSMGGVEIFLVTSCYRDWDKLSLDWSLGLYADYMLYVMKVVKITKGYIVRFIKCYLPE